MPRTLSEADADLFYQLFFPLLGYVNENTGSSPACVTSCRE